MKIPDKFKNRKSYITGLPKCEWISGTKKMSPYILIQCSDCKEKFRLYYGTKKDKDKHIELAGVFADIDWYIALLQFVKKLGGK